MNTMILVGVLFAAVSILLVRSKFDRVIGVFFVIRSGLGIKLIDSIAKLRPKLWEFIADYSVLLSFGGIGAYYLSSNRETQDNFYRGFLLSGIIISAAAVFLSRYELAMGFLVLVALMKYMMSRIRNPIMDTALTVVIFCLGFAMIFEPSISMLFGIFGLPAVMVYVMFTHGINILLSKTTLPGVSPMLPSTKGGEVGVGFPGYDLFIPWWHVLVALFITLVVHEGSHGILTRVANVKLKSTGLLTFLAMPIGAFVEPDDDELNKKPGFERMRIYSMGSFANLVTGFAAATIIVLIINLSSGLVYSNGMKIVGFIDGYPAEAVIPKDTVIYSINGDSTSNMASFKNITAGLKPDMRVSLNTSEGSYSLKLAKSDKDPNKGILGIYVMENIDFKGPIGLFISVSMMSFILESLGWIAFFNINICLVNLLPILPFDGGRMFKELISTMEMTQVNINRVLYASIAFMALLFLVNTLPLLRIIWDFVFSLV
jgi:membrane-associated protease RseP (regulator of RpoE activity)